MDYISVLKNRKFSLLWIGQIGSGFGSWVYNIALLIFMSKLKLSGIVISGLMMTTMIPYILVGPIVGNYIDGKKRKKVMVISDTIRFLLTIVLVPLLYINTSNNTVKITIILLIYLASLCSSFAGTFFGPANKAIIPLLIDKEQIKSANSLMSMTGAMTLVLGPAFGVILVSALGLAGVFWFNGLTFLFSAICILFINLKEETTKSKTEFETLLTKYFKGWKLITSNREITFYVIVAAVRSLVVGVINISFIFVASRLFSKGSESVGWLYSSLGLGVILGSFTIGIFKAKIKDRNLYLLAVLVNALLSIVYIKTDVWYIALVSLFIVGFSDGFQMVMFNTSIQKSYDTKNIGKVFASSYALMMCFQLFSMCLGGSLFDSIDHSKIVLITAIITIVLSIITYLWARKSANCDIEPVEI
jgi:MFS transporter, DHA3 family, macrolide efflux protein